MSEEERPGGAIAGSAALVDLADEDVLEEAAIGVGDPTLAAFIDEGKPLSQWLLFRRRKAVA